MHAAIKEKLKDPEFKLELEKFIILCRAINHSKGYTRLGFDIPIPATKKDSINKLNQEFFTEHLMESDCNYPDFKEYIDGIFHLPRDHKSIAKDAINLCILESLDISRKASPSIQPLMLPVQ